MARRVFWPTVETSKVTIFARGIVSEPACADATSDCCDPPDQSVCCPDGFETVLPFSALGPLDADFGSVLLEYELNWDPTRGSWIGGTEDASGASIAFETYCVTDEEFGTLWVIAGSYYSVELQLYMPFFVWGTLPGNGYITAEIEVPGTTEVITLVVQHPCPTEENGGGSIPCATLLCSEVPTTATFTGTITNKVGVCSCLPDTVSMVWNLSNNDWEATASYTCLLMECEENATALLACDGDNWVYNGSLASTSVTCVSGVLTIVFDVTPTFGGSYTITFTLD